MDDAREQWRMATCNLALIQVNCKADLEIPMLGTTYYTLYASPVGGDGVEMITFLRVSESTIHDFWTVIGNTNAGCVLATVQLKLIQI